MVFGMKGVKSGIAAVGGSLSGKVAANKSLTEVPNGLRAWQSTFAAQKGAAMMGAGVGAAYGALDSDTGIIGGAIGGAALFGAGHRYGMSGFNKMKSAKSYANMDAFDIAAGVVGRGMRQAGVDVSRGIDRASVAMGSKVGRNYGSTTSSRLRSNKKL